MTIALSHGGSTIYYQSDRPSTRVLVGTARGIAVMDRNGAGWQLSETWLPDKHISALLITPDGGAIFAGAYGDGSLHMSPDGGATWQPRSNGIDYTNIFSLGAATVDGGLRLFCGTEPAHLFVSADLGETWQERPGLRDIPTVDTWDFPEVPHIAHAKHISFDPRDPNIMYVSIEVGGLLRSADGGVTWHDVPGMYRDVHRLLINPIDPQRMHLAGGEGLWQSSDGGATWRSTTDLHHEIGGYPDQLVYHPANPDLLFVAAAQHNPGAWRRTHFAGARISRSRDGGATWQVLTNGLPDRLQGNVEAMCLEAVGDGCSLFAATTAGEVWASDDSGESWSIALSGLAPISKGGHFVPLLAGRSTV